jgi:hypothetical protein
MQSKCKKNVIIRYDRDLTLGMNRVQYRTNYVRNTHNPYCILISLCMCILNLEGNQMTLTWTGSALNWPHVDSSLIRLSPCEATFKQHVLRTSLQTKIWMDAREARDYVRNTHNPYCILISLCMCILNLEGNQMTFDLQIRQVPDQTFPLSNRTGEVTP